TQLPEVIRGHTATIRFEPRPHDGFSVMQQKLEGKPAPPGTNQGEGGDRCRPDQPREDTRSLWEHYIECMRSRNPDTLCPAELGYAAITTVNMGVQSYREGKALFFNKENGQVVEADSSWAARWEERSRLRGKPNQVIGWQGNPFAGSTVHSHPHHHNTQADLVN